MSVSNVTVNRALNAMGYSLEFGVSAPHTTEDTI
jgi:hypothetical protein